MKTKFLRIGKGSVSVVLSFLMILSTVLVGSVGTLDANAANLTSESSGTTLNGEHVYFFQNINPSGWANKWLQNSDEIGYLYSDKGTFTAKQVPNDSDVYYAIVPADSYNRFVWARGNSDGTWWNKTENINVSETNNYLTSYGAYDPDNNSLGYISFNSTYKPTVTTSISTTTTDAKTGVPVEFSSTIGTNSNIAEYKSSSYIVTKNGSSATSGTDYTVSGNSITFLTSGTYTVEDNVTYNAKGFDSITGTQRTSNSVSVTVTPSVNVTYLEGTTTTVDDEGNTVGTTKGGTFSISSNIVTATPTDTSYSVHSVTYTYTTTDDNELTGEAVALGDNKYSINVPDNTKENSTVTVNVTFGPLRTFTVTAHVDDTNKKSSYETEYNVSIASSGKPPVTSTGSGLISMDITEGSSVTLTINDTGTKDDYIIDKWSISGDYTLRSGDDLELKGRQSGSDSYDKHTVTITPTGNVDATAYFKEDEGVAYGTYHVCFSYSATANDRGNLDKLTKYLQVYETYGKKYYAYLSSADYQFANGSNSYYFALSQRADWNYVNLVSSDKVYVEVDDSVSAYVSYESKNGGYDIKTERYGNNEWNQSQKFSYPQININKASLDYLKIQITGDLDNDQKFRISAKLNNIEEDVGNDNVLVIAKDGTIRGSYTKYAKLADTTIDSAVIGDDTYTRDSNKLTKDGTSYLYLINATSFNGLSETVTLPRGSKITFTTEITSDTSLYKVEAFVVNGETVLVKNVDGDKYTGEYTIPETDDGNKFIEITPVYFYKTDESGKAKDKAGNEVNVITFYVENFDDNAKEAWGKPYDSNYNSNAATLSCYAWYDNNQGIDLLDASDVNKPALGGYPGQPMVYEDGRYVMQVPAEINGQPVKGITLNNYVWDYVHSYTLGAEAEGSSGDAKRETINCQTYDYDDFVKLSQLIANDKNYNDVVVFRFKYRTNMNPAPEASYYNNRFFGNTPDSDGTSLKAVSNYKNGWEDYLDYYDNTIDLFNFILSDDDIKAADGKHFYIVSDGYRDLYLGHFGVLWYIYDTEGSYVGCLPSSAFFYDYTKALENNGGETLPNDVPNDFITVEGNNYFPGSYNDVKYYWSVYKTLYNGGTLDGRTHTSALGIPAIITYETAIRAQDSNSNGHPRDPGLRSDGRWFYSKKLPISANIIIEYKPTANSKDYVEDTINKVTGDFKFVGATTGAHAYFTTVGDYKTEFSKEISISKKAEENASNTTVDADSSKSFNFTADEDESTGYVFEGWYIKTADGYELNEDGTVKTDNNNNPIVKYNYYPVNSNSLLDKNGKVPLTGNPTLVARYAPATDSLTITHNLYNDDYATVDNEKATKYSDSPEAHNGKGTPTVTAKVVKVDGATVTDVEGGNFTAKEGSETSVSINKTTLETLKKNGESDKYKVQVTLEITPDSASDSKLYTIYRKSNDESGLETGKNDKNGYVAYNAADQTKDANDIATWTNDKVNDNSLKDSTDKVTVTYTVPFKDLFDDDGNLKTNIVRFFSDLDAPITANIIIEYKLTATSTEYVEDTPKSEDSLYTSVGTVTGAHAYFTKVGDDKTTFEYKTSVTKEDNVYADSSKNFEFTADESDTTGYVFEGWYIRTEDGFESDGTTVKYKYTPVNSEDLLDKDGSVPLTGNPTLVARYAPISKIDVEFKYYDRNDDSNHSKPETINTTPTTIVVKDLAIDERGLTQTIDTAIHTKGFKTDADGNPVGSIAFAEITSVIDKYHVWISQAQAADTEKGFPSLTNHHAGFDENNKEQTYSDSITNSENLKYHADYYGYTKGESGYSLANDDETWVTYYKADGLSTFDNEDDALDNPSLVSKVVVWAFNTPKDYTISFYVPDSDTQVTENNNYKVSLATGIIGFTSAQLAQFKGKYNERVGKSYNYENGVDDLSDYLKNVYNITGSSNGKLTINKDTTERNISEAVLDKNVKDLSKLKVYSSDDNYNYEFDGWYAEIKDSNDEVTGYVKVSSDPTYANRITNDLTLIAGYRTANSNETKGLTVTKNQTEKYIDEIKDDDGIIIDSQERIRYVTQVNTYGCDDSDPNIKDIAIIYIKPYGNNTSFTDSQIADIVKNVKDSDDVKALLSDSRKNSVTTISDESSYNGIVYAYDVIITKNDGSQYLADDPNNKLKDDYEITSTQIALTNKNRVQFTLDLPIETVQENGKNSDIVVIAAMNYNGTYTPSDNYIRYTNGE